MRKLVFYLSMFELFWPPCGVPSMYPTLRISMQGKPSESWWGFQREAASTRIPGSWPGISANIYRAIRRWLLITSPGRSSLIAANSIYKATKPDGLTIGNFIGNLISQQLFGVVESNSMRESLSGLGASKRSCRLCPYKSERDH